MSKRVEFTIKNGDVSIDLKGFTDGSCKGVMDKFAGLGTQTKEVLYPEAHNQCDTTTTNTVKA
jgi:hypothetical protein